eukprot:1290481-Rhodomonas_salina.1
MASRSLSSALRHSFPSLCSSLALRPVQSPRVQAAHRRQPSTHPAADQHRSSNLEGFNIPSHRGHEFSWMAAPILQTRVHSSQPLNARSFVRLHALVGKTKRKRGARQPRRSRLPTFDSESPNAVA